MKVTAHLLPSQPAPEGEQSSVRRSAARRLTSAPASPAQRNSRLSEKLIAAQDIQRRLPADNRVGQLLAIAILRRDESLLDELLRRLEPKRRS